MMPSDVTELIRPLRAAYYTSVRRLALAAVQAFPLDASQETDERREESIAQAIEGSSWMIYTYSAKAALLVSDNDDAAEEMLGEDEARQSSVEHRASLAMLEDVRGLIEAWREHGVPPEEAEEVRP